MVVADNKTRGNGLKLQFGRFRLNTKTAFIWQHSNRYSEGELCPCRFSILLNGQSHSWSDLVLVTLSFAAAAWTKDLQSSFPTTIYIILRMPESIPQYWSPFLVVLE